MVNSSSFVAKALASRAAVRTVVAFRLPWQSFFDLTLIELSPRRFILDR
jgi:hypothetical protein